MGKLWTSSSLVHKRTPILPFLPHHPSHLCYFAYIYTQISKKRQCTKITKQSLVGVKFCLPSTKYKWMNHNKMMENKYEDFFFLQTKLRSNNKASTVNATSDTKPVRVKAKANRTLWQFKSCGFKLYSRPHPPLAKQHDKPFSIDAEALLMLATTQILTI